MMTESIPRGQRPATYLLIVDNYERRGKASPHYTPARIREVLAKVARRWPNGVDTPTIVVGSSSTEGPRTAAYRGFSAEPELLNHA